MKNNFEVFFIILPKSKHGINALSENDLFIVLMRSTKPIQFLFRWKTKDVQDKVEKQFAVVSINKRNYNIKQL